MRAQFWTKSPEHYGLTPEVLRLVVIVQNQAGQDCVPFANVDLLEPWLIGIATNQDVHARFLKLLRLLTVESDARGTTMAFVVERPSSAVRRPDAVPSIRKTLIDRPGKSAPIWLTP